MRCHCTSGNGPWLPTLEQVTEAARTLPNPNTYHRGYTCSVYAPSAMAFRAYTDGAIGCVCEIHVMRFELAAAPRDAFCAPRREWRYTGGVRV